MMWECARKEDKLIVAASDASGAVRAARQGLSVMIVDVIDMSTTLESALDDGALAVFGASPDQTRAPVQVNPFNMGETAAKTARELGTGLIVVAEPRVGTEKERADRCSRLLDGIAAQGMEPEAVIPNLGHETPRLLSLKNKVVVAATDTGGVAYDAAFQVTGRVTIGTVARTFKQKGEQPARTAAERAIRLMDGAGGIAVVAASSNSLEDILAAKYIMELILRMPFGG